MKIRKIISVLLAAIMMMSVTSFSAFAEDEMRIAKVIEYLNAPSQYTNNTAYGINIDSTLDGKVVSLGNFGGYAVYEFNEPVMNSDDHAYGVDFIIEGNAFNADYTTQEPGQIWVSQDGESWYALAGSEHFEDETVWNYSLTYSESEERKCSFKDSLGDSGIVSPAPYPLSENYPTAVIPENELTLSGILLKKQRIASTANGIQTSFGYVDTLKRSETSSPCNPYCENPYANGRDGQFDISWAVDENGIGVELDYIKFVKVQTATFIDGAMFGEKSTEISALTLAEKSEKNIIKTSVPKCITVDGKTLDVSDGNTYFDVSVDGDFDVNVDTDANVYINNFYGTSRHFTSKTEKGIIRIIVQSGDNSPLIYYINTGKGVPKAKIALSETAKEIELGKTSKISAVTDNGEKILWSSSDETIASVDENGKITAKSLGSAYIIATAESGSSEKCRVTVTEPAKPVCVNVSFSVSGGVPVQKHTMTVSSDMAEKYGYDIAEKDHNGIKIDGVTVFDVIVASHEEIYGEAFRQNSENYLVMTSSFITKAFGQKAASSGFIVNGVMPNDGIISADFNGCTGYACDTARVNDGDNISYFFYQDSKFFSDYYSWFDLDEYNVNADESLTVNLNGYCAMEYGINEWQTILERYAEPLRGIKVYAYIDGEKVFLGTTDKKGNAEIRFSEEGEYVIFAEGVTEDESPIITPYASVKVDPKQDDRKPKKFREWIKRVWNKIKNWFVKAFNFLFGWIKK